MQKSHQSLKQKVFGLDNKVMRVSAKVFDLMILNLSFVISCIPLVTIGPAIITIYRMTTRIREEATLNVGREYWKEFKGNWQQGLLLGILACFITVAIYLNVQIFSSIQHPLALALEMLSYGIGFISLITVLYAFLISSQFTTDYLKLIKNAFLLSFLNFSKTVQVVTPIILIAILLMYSPMTMLVTLSILLCIGFSLIAYFQTKIIQSVFDKYH